MLFFLVGYEFENSQKKVTFFLEEEKIFIPLQSQNEKTI